ncbi:putative reverse transcriptase domain-containing protein [Tanacetum coccineum]
MYLTASRPDIMFAVCVCARFQVTPKTSHFNVVNRIFRYLKGQPKLGLWYPRDSPFDLEAFSDSDYAGASLDRKSTTGDCQFLGKRLISWKCKKQTIVANSTTEAEYVAAANCYGQRAILMVGILTDEVVRCGTLTKGNAKRKEMEESSKQGSTWKDNKKSKTVSGFVATVPPMNDNNQMACYECGSLDHLRYDCPKWKQATSQTRNPLALEGNKNTQNNGNQARGKAFNGNFAPLLNVEPCIVNPGYAIEIANGKSVEVDWVICDCILELRNSLFTIDLISLGHGSFDLIMGMD